MHITAYTIFILNMQSFMPHTLQSDITLEQCVRGESLGNFSFIFISWSKLKKIKNKNAGDLISQLEERKQGATTVGGCSSENSIHLTAVWIQRTASSQLETFMHRLKGNSTLSILHYCMVIAPVVCNSLNVSLCITAIPGHYHFFSSSRLINS